MKRTSNPYRRLGIVLAVLALASQGATGTGGARAADAAKSDPPAAKKPASSSLDDELFQDLDLGKKPKAKDPVKGDAPPTGKPPPVAPPKSTSPAPGATGGEAPPAKSASPVRRSELDEELLRQLGGDEEPLKKKQQQGPARGGPDRSEEKGSDNPLTRLSRQIREAEQRLRKADSGEQTQEMQRKIVEDLDKLIAQIERQQQQKSQSQSQSKKPNAPQQGKQQQVKQPKPGNQPGQESDKPAADSGDQLTDKKNEKPTTGKLQDMLEKVWGELPERQRQDVMQASFDDFPAKYQYVIEEYFKTLLKRQD